MLFRCSAEPGGAVSSAGEGGRAGTQVSTLRRRLVGASLPCHCTQRGKQSLMSLSNLTLPGPPRLGCKKCNFSGNKNFHANLYLVSSFCSATIDQHSELTEVLGKQSILCIKHKYPLLG